jgi:hypothetical protein
MNEHAGDRFFFIHVMKTGGGTFGQHISSNFAENQIYPHRKLDRDPRKAYTNIAYLTSLPPRRLARIRIFRGHFPFVATEALGLDVVTLSILRDPAERILSFLKLRKDARGDARSLEEIYEDPFLFPRLLHNHQAKVFGLELTRDDRMPSVFGAVDIDERRLQTAKANVEKVDVLGLQERFDEFLAELADRYGWRFGAVPNRHVTENIEVSRSFRRRIADDNAADIEFFEHARSVYERRRNSRATRAVKKERMHA